MEAKGLDLSYIITVIRSRLRKCVESASSCWNGWVERNSSESVTASWHSSQACQADLNFYLYHWTQTLCRSHWTHERQGGNVTSAHQGRYISCWCWWTKSFYHTKCNRDIPAHCPSLLSDHRTFPQLLPPRPCQQSSQELWLRHHCGKHETGEQRFAIRGEVEACHLLRKELK